MKTLIVLAFILGLATGVFAVDKNVVYNKDTKEIIGVAVKTTPTKDSDRVDIVCEGDILISGAKTDKLITIAIDNKSIPADITTKTYKIDTITKDIYEPITIEYINGYKIKNIKKEIIGRLTLSSGTTYNIYDMKGTKLGTYKASVKLTTTNIKDREFKLIKISTGYTIKE
jgi:hypothetical protein